MLTSPENGIDDKVYKSNKKLMAGLFFLSMASVGAGFFFNFSIEDKVMGLLDQNLRGNRSCPMNYRKADLGFFLPSLKIRDLDISSYCLKSKNSLNIKSVETGLGLPSFSPLGPSLETTIKDKYSRIEITSVHGISNHYIKANSRKLSARTLQPLLGNFNLAGDFELNTNIDATTKKIQSLDLSIKSKNFTIPSQDISGFNVPTMKIGQLGLKASMRNGKTLTIQQLVLGKELSPIRASIKGKIQLDKYSIQKSNLDLTATVKFSTSFIENFSILNLLLDSSKRDEQGFYHLKITGPLGKPNKPEYINP